MIAFQIEFHLSVCVDACPFRISVHWSVAVDFPFRMNVHWSVIDDYPFDARQ